ncbi:lipase [Naegleria gruberi]|uniref:Lipase n=1 Tax=Naegleria gruberi TaxID=5762 RepID=D2V4W0_NAEGR|nr:lipase [Naegleria gruberi]EFC48173.1 lipase [Naegleria gruberi]|eukprot:XP_002680917.1 lipase [Naegleria gruberi]
MPGFHFGTFLPHLSLGNSKNLSVLPSTRSRSTSQLESSYHSQDTENIESVVDKHASKSLRFLKWIPSLLGDHNIIKANIHPKIKSSHHKRSSIEERSNIEQTIEKMSSPPKVPLVNENSNDHDGKLITDQSSMVEQFANTSSSSPSSYFDTDNVQNVDFSKFSQVDQEEPILKYQPENQDLYGLDIFYHQNSLFSIEGPEDRFTLIDNTLEIVMSSKSLFLSEAKKYENNLSNGNIYLLLKCILELSKEIEGYLKQLKNKLVQLELLKNDRYPNQSKLEETYCTSHSKNMASFDLNFIDSAFHFRGCFLVIIYTFKECINDINKVIKNRGSFFFSVSDGKYEKWLDIYQQKFQVLKTMVTVSNTLLQERIDKIDTNNSSFIPFSQSIKIGDMEELKNVKPSAFMEHIGSFYDSEVAWFLALIVKATASFGHTQDIPSKLKKDLIFYAASAYYLVNPKTAAENCVDLFNKNPIASSEFWNIQDNNKFIKTFTYLGYPYIETSQKFNIPFPNRKIVDSVGLDIDGDEFEYVSVSKEAPQNSSIILFGNNNENDQTEKLQVYYSEDEDELSEEEKTDTTKTPIEFNSSTTNMYPNMEGFEDVKEGSSAMEFYYGAMEESMKNHNFQEIGLRLLSTKPLSEAPEYITSQQQEFPYLSQIMKAINSIKTKQEEAGKNTFDGSIILHIHGGGFIAMESFSHEIYLRRWCSEMHIPIISVDYRRSPQEKFPVQIEECYAAYQWLLANCEKVLGAPLKRIVIAGDSAGGNLTLAVAQRAIRDGIRLPDALVLSYPVTYLDFSPSPSRQISVIEPLVNINFLRLCGELYCKDSDNAFENPFVSPAMIDEEVLKKFPPTYFDMGALDPLFDDGIYMAKRIAKNNGGRVKIQLYDALGHGYLNMIDYSKEARLASANICQWISQFLQ